MTRSQIGAVLIAACGLWGHRCGGASEPADQAAVVRGQVVVVTIPSPSLAGNLLGDPTTQQGYVYLPPSYASSQRRYPVLYFLHGFDESPSEISPFAASLESLVAAGRIREMIVVGVNGRNALGGSFYVNSPVTGGWLDYLVRDVVGYVDATYRTIPDRSSRGIAGFSMGGFAAFNAAFRYPDIYSALFCLAPGLFGENGLQDAWPQWDGRFRSAYGAAFSPDPTGPSPFAHIPRFDGTSADNAIFAYWVSGFGNLQAKIDAYRSRGIALRAIRLEYGVHDSYRWIPAGCQSLSRLLTAAGIVHDLKTFEGGHQIPMPILESDMFPFFSTNLDG